MMTPVVISVLVFACLFGAALLGLRLRQRLPDHHLSDDTKDAVRLGMGSVATMAALLLGLLVASTKSTYDTEKSEVIQMSSKVIWLDRVLDNYGPGARECRQLLRHVVHAAVLRIWPDPGLHPLEGAADPASMWSRDLPLAIQRLDPQTDAQRSFKSQAIAVAAELGQMRWLLFEQAHSSVSTPLIVIMVFWMALTYGSIGLFAPPNSTVVAAQLLAALAVAGALFLILEFDSPFSGMVRISSEPMVSAFQQLAK
jgi:hypothetical protein